MYFNAGTHRMRCLPCFCFTDSHVTWTQNIKKIIIGREKKSNNPTNLEPLLCNEYNVSWTNIAITHFDLTLGCHFGGCSLGCHLFVTY